MTHKNITGLANFSKRGDWVEVHNIVLHADQRSQDLPQDTSTVPLESWIRGWALEEGVIGQEIEIETAAGRRVRGVLTCQNPGYSHTYGPTVPELATIGKELREILREVGGGRNR
ncbi:MAG: 2-amino-4-oxopentanoate thiolase subunit OrtA [Bacillota bacterium]